MKRYKHNTKNLQAQRLLVIKLIYLNLTSLKRKKKINQEPKLVMQIRKSVVVLVKLEHHRVTDLEEDLEVMIDLEENLVKGVATYLKKSLLRKM